MKKAPFRFLVYREFVLAGKSLGICMTIFICMAFVGLMVQLSFRIGNLALLSLEDKQLYQEMFYLYVKIIPIFTASSMVSAVSEQGTNKEINPLWQRFRLSTPVSPWRFALAKYISIIIMFILSLGLSFAYMGMLCGISNEKLTISDVSVVITVLAVFFIFAVCMQLLIMLFRSMDKAGLVCVGGMMAIILPMLIRNAKKKAEVSMAGTMDGAVEAAINAGFDSIGEKVESICVSALPYAFLAIAVGLVGGFVATALLYKRRER